MLGLSLIIANDFSLIVSTITKNSSLSFAGLASSTALTVAVR
jgi:hypothetical protein